MDGGRAAGVVAYDRERGRFHVFAAKAVILATGGVGRAYKITSNSWEGTGDGHALAYRAGAELIDMEFIQFHPTGMVWPPSVKGILVTEGVRGEGGVLKNSEGRRFMFDDIPDNYKPQTASDPEEGWRYTQGDKSARRPPELLTRDHVARCIMREVKAGRGIAARRRLSRHRVDQGEAAERARSTSSASSRACITSSRSWPISTSRTTPMEVGPTTHYIMGGVRVDADSQMSTIPGLFAAGECASGINGANRLGGNSLSDLIVFGKRAGEYAADFARKQGAVKVDDGAVERAIKESLAPFERGASGENPYKVQEELQDTMQNLVGIVRQESEMQRGARPAAGLQGARRARRRVGPPRIQRRLAHGARSGEPADGGRSDHALGDRAQGEPRRPLPRGLSGQDRRSSARSTSWSSAAGGRHRRFACPDSGDAAGVEAGHRGAETMTRTESG